MDNWYIIFNGNQVGPIEKSELTSYGLNPSSMVWRPGMADWRKASEMPELASLLNPSIDVEEVKVEQPYNRAAHTEPPHTNDAYQRAYNQGYYDGTHNPNPYSSPNGKSKIATGILALLVGSLGVQYFYLGKVGAGFITILLTIITCGCWEIITFIQGILIICMSDEEFARKFVYTDKTFPLF